MAIWVKWLGYSSFWIRALGKIIYVDLKKYGKVVETSERADITLVTHNHGDRLKKIDLALLPTGDKYTMDNAEAAEATKTINPKIAMAMHTWENDREEFKTKVEANSKTKVGYCYKKAKNTN